MAEDNDPVFDDSNAAIAAALADLETGVLPVPASISNAVSAGGDFGAAPSVRFVAGSAWSGGTAEYVIGSQNVIVSAEANASAIPVPASGLLMAAALSALALPGRKARA